MVTSTHADHRLASRTHPAGARPATSFGVPYPENDLIAVIDDLDEAERAATAIIASGVAADDVDVLDGASFLSNDRTIERHRGLISRLCARLSRLFSDDAAEHQALLNEARQGHALLIVHAAQATIAERTRAVLAAHHAHDLRLYRRGCIETLA